MPSWLEALRLKQLFGIPDEGMIGNDLPSQGGFGGNMPRSVGPVRLGGGTGVQPPVFGRPTPLAERVNPFETAPSTPMGGGGLEDIMARVNQVYTPETAASDRFNQMIEQFPERNKPGILRKLGAGLINYKYGPQEGDKFLNKPYYEKLSDWKQKIGPAQQAAQLERQGNINERTLAMQTISAQLREEAQRHKESNDETRAKIAQQRADVYEYKAKNPNLEFNFTGPTVKVLDPATGKLADTGIPTGNLSDADKLALQQKQALERIRTTGKVRSGLQEEEHQDTLEEIGARGEEARTTKSTPSGSETGKPELPTQTRVRQFNAARELYNSRPDLRPFIRIGTPGSSDFQVQPPGTRMFFGTPTGPNADQFAEINSAIYGGALGRQSGGVGGSGGGKKDTGRGSKVQPIRKTQRNKATGETREVESTDGGKTWHPVKAKK